MIKLTLFSFLLCVIYSSAFHANKRLFAGIHEIAYDVEMTKTPIHTISESSVLQQSPELLIFESAGKYSLLDYITCGEFLGKIVNITSPQFVAVSVPITEIIQEGTISILPAGNGEMDKDFCLGWNTQSCVNPSSSINLFNNKYMTVDCDNCFIGLSGTAFVKLEFEVFKLKNVEIGFKNLNVKGALGVKVDSSHTFAYTFQKTYPLINSLDIASFYIGPVKIHLWMSLPVEIDFSASANVNAQVRLGNSLNVGLGSFYLDYTPGSKVKIIKPSPQPSLTPYFTTIAEANGDAVFRVIPSLNFYVDNLLRFTTTFNPSLEAKAWASLADRKACVSGQYEVSASVKGTFVSYTFGPDTVFDTGVKPIGTVCKTF